MGEDVRIMLMYTNEATSDLPLPSKVVVLWKFEWIQKLHSKPKNTQYQCLIAC